MISGLWAQGCPVLSGTGRGEGSSGQADSSPVCESPVEEVGRVSSGWDDFYGESTFRDESSVPRNCFPGRGGPCRAGTAPRCQNIRK